MDTQNLTLALLATGLTQQELADLLECSQATVNAFSKGNRGSRPTYAIGKKLEEAHARLCRGVAAPAAPLSIANVAMLSNTAL